MAVVSLEDFEQEARGFLDAHARPRTEEEFVWGEGPDKVAVFDERSREHEREDLARAQAWRATKFDAGFGWIGGPKAYGGRELSHAHERLWASLEGHYDVPNQSYFVIGLGMLTGTLMGLRLGSLMIRYMGVTETGDEVLPPLQLHVSWFTAGSALLVLGMVFLVTIGIVVLLYSRLALHRVLRIGEA